MVAQIDSTYFKTRPTKVYGRLVAHTLLQGRPLTTSGQWLNPLIVSQLSMAKRLPLLKGIKKPIYILGTGRSGSTVLGTILSLHPEIVFLNEAKALWHSAYAQEDLIGTYSRGQANYKMNAMHLSKQTEQDLQRLYSYALTITGSNRILDKHGEMIFRVKFIQSVFPDAKFVFLVRNGWDTVASIATWSKQFATQKGSERHDWWGADKRKWNLLVQEIVKEDDELRPYIDEIHNFERQEDMAATEWVATIREGLRLIEVDNLNLHTVSYENMIDNPKSVLEKLLTFCELELDEVLLNYAQDTLAPNTPKQKVDLNSCIHDIFLKTMDRLDTLLVETYEENISLT